MAESFLNQLFLPHNVHFHVILPRLYQTDIILHTGLWPSVSQFPYQCGSCNANMHHHEMGCGPSLGLMKRCAIAHLMFPFATIKSWNDGLVRGRSVTLIYECSWLWIGAVQSGPYQCNTLRLEASRIIHDRFLSSIIPIPEQRITSDPEHNRCHCRHQPSIATGCVAHSWVYEIVLDRWFAPIPY